VNENVWDAIQRDSSLSKFVEYIKNYDYDTLFLTNHTYTLFVPSNTAFTNFIDSAGVVKAILDYNISQFYIQSENIQGIRKIQTLGKKYALFSKTELGAALDGIPLYFESPLYVNGKYFVMDQIAYPKYNLYEYFAVNNKVLKDYIDDLDTLIIDKARSRPLGFDDQGNTIYDTVAEIFNLFEIEYFPVKHESRYKTATFVFPKAEDYNIALDSMAKALGGGYIDHNDIPLAWQNKVLVPYLLERGVFENMLEEHEFVLDPVKDDTLKLKNILGDSVVIDYTPTQKTLCSNGYAYNYANFRVPDTLWNAPIRFEGEHLVRNIGTNRWAWKEGISVNYTSNFEPTQSYNATYASEDSFLLVTFSNTYIGTYNVEFNVDNLFPRKYLAVVRTNLSYGGKYNIYVNGKFVKYIDYSSFSRGVYTSPESGIRYTWDAGRIFISFDFWIDTDELEEYGKSKIKFEYIGPSSGVRFRGLSIDYIEFKPYK
jgi:hypothetical protein